MDLRILFENGDMVAVEKPQGMPAQPDRTGDADLLSLLSAQMKQELGLVHRLDRPVGGIMVFAKTKQAEAALSKMMRLAEILSDCPLGHFGGKKRYMDRLSFQKRQNQSVRSGVRFQKRRQESYFALSGTCRNHVE